MENKPNNTLNPNSQIQKMAKNLNKQFYWEDITVPNKRLKKVFNTTDNQESTNQSPNELIGLSQVPAIRQTNDDD